MEEERIKDFDVCVCLGVNYTEKRERIAPEKCSKGPKFFFFWGNLEARGIYIFICDPSASGVHKVCTLEFQAHTKCVSVLDSHATSISDFECSFECLQKLRLN